MGARWARRGTPWTSVLLAACALGCSAEEPSRRGTQQNSAVAEVGACTRRNLTSACQCQGGLPGRQVCTDGAWTSCECRDPGGAAGSGGGGTVPTFEGNLRTDITFVWERTPITGSDGSCLPGQYEGNFFGIYYSYIATASGIQGLGVPVANLDPPNAPSGFHFTVEPAQGGETIQKIKGEMNGIADGVFPFAAKIEGELDCRTATFTARMSEGKYSVLADGLLPQSFEGVMSGHYDKRTHTFVDGEWDVRETSSTPPGMLAPTQPRDFARDGYGGSGQWAAGLPSDPNDPSLTACPTNYTCSGGPLGPNKKLCGGPLGPVVCVTDADCNTPFPGEGVPCLKASAFSICLRECKP